MPKKSESSPWPMFGQLLGINLSKKGPVFLIQFAYLLLNFLLQLFLLNFLKLGLSP